MTVRELKDKLSEYPDDMEVTLIYPGSFDTLVQRKHISCIESELDTDDQEDYPQRVIVIY